MQYQKLAERLANQHHKNIINTLKDGDDAQHQSEFGTETLKEDLNLALGRILSIQMNNHFLFNTLNAIAGLALDENSFKTYRAVVDLSKLFRYNLRSGQEFVTINDEVNYVKNYVELQRIRFGDRLQITMNIADSSRKYYVPFNTLQPLVENAFVHGFSEFNELMSIIISIDSVGNSINIRVQDNGRGISDKTRKELIKSIDSRKKPRHGLSMIADRLELFFGQNFSYQIDSQLESGFALTLTIPKRTLNDEMLG